MASPIDTSTPAAQRALYAGILKAKQDAQRKAAILAGFGWPLLIGIMLVSFIHLWETIGLFKPEYVPALQLPAFAYNLTSGLFVAAIDTAAIYALSAANVARLAGNRSGRNYGGLFFLLLTFLLNAAFFVRYAPSLPEGMRSFILPARDIAFVFLLPAFVAVAIFSVERAMDLASVARLKLMVETTALAELAASPAAIKVTRQAAALSGNAAVISSGSVNGNIAEDASGASGGKPRRYLLADLIAVMEAERVYSRAELAEQVGAGSTTMGNLIAEGMASGVIERVANGTYQRVAVVQQEEKQ